MSQKQGDYDQLAKRMAELSYLGQASGILGWDIKTYMPKGGIEQRAQTLAILDVIGHDKLVDPKNGQLIQQCISTPTLSTLQKRNIELWQREYDRATKIPSDLVEKLSKQTALTEANWENAKHASNFQIIQADLEKLLDLTKQKAYALNPSGDPYDTMLDLYEPKMTGALVKSYFDPLRDAVVKLVKKCGELKNLSSPEILHQEVTDAQQSELGKWAIGFVGLDPNRSRIDLSEHPFTTGYGDDVRITTHYLPRDPLASFSSVMHEAGHALYELNLPHEQLWTAVGNSISLGVHESQSRFVENMIGKNPVFLQFLYSKIGTIIPSFKNIPFETFNKAINAVVPSKIRIYADEVTYNLHIILRFELEQAMMQEKITVKELPMAWNEKMEKYFGIKIEKDQEGVLQDTHWYGGLFGYFPDYVLGNLYNGQMWATIQKKVPNWSDLLVRGEWNPLREWLITNIHRNASLYDPIDLMKVATGEVPDPRYFISYLESKYHQIFGI